MSTYHNKFELIPFAENIWYVQGAYKLIGANLGTKMTVIRLDDGKLLLHSPVAFNETLASEITRLGNPAYIVAPSTMHNLHMDGWSQRFSELKTYAAKGARIAASVEPLEESIVFPWENGICSILIAGMPKVNEWVFVHKSSGTLIVCDLLFNVTEPTTRWTRYLTSLYGIYQRCTITPLFNMMVKDKEAFQRSLLRVSKQDFDKIIISHGNNVTSDGHKQFCQNSELSL